MRVPTFDLPAHILNGLIRKLVDATVLGGGQRMACALADHVSLMLGSGGEHCVADDRENPRARR